MSAMIIIRHLEIGELKKVSSRITEVVTGKVAAEAEKIEKNAAHMIISGDNGFELSGSVVEVCSKIKQMFADDQSLKFVNFKGDDMTEDIRKLVEMYT